MTTSGSVGGRIHYIDWLRAAAVVGVVVYHALMPFGTSEWHINNTERARQRASRVSAMADALADDAISYGKMKGLNWYWED